MKLAREFHGNNGALIAVYHGTAEDWASAGYVADLLFADPPYGQKLARSNMGTGNTRNLTSSKLRGGHGKTPPPKRTAFADSAEWDGELPSPGTIHKLRLAHRHQVIFGGHLFTLPATRGWLIWDKCHSADFAHCEMAWTNLDQPIRRIAHKWNGMIQEAGHKEKRWHPCQKPQRVIDWALDFFPGIRTVCDPYAGGGSTGLACLRRGLHCTLIEREAANIATILQRLTTEGKQWL